MTAPRPAFDALAPTYDADFTSSLIARTLRTRTHLRLLELLRPGDSVLELGCGTGEDARFLGERGFTVTATDASPGMLRVARAKCAGLENVRFEAVDLNELPLTPQPPLPRTARRHGGSRGEGEFASQQFAPSKRNDKVQRYTLAFANFGVVNCVSDLSALGAWLAEQIPSGGHAVFAVMSPYCLWEIGWHGLHGNFKTALRRLRSDTTFQAPAATRHEATPPEAASADERADSTGYAPIPLRYPPVHRLTAAFAPDFRRIQVEPLGLFLPPSDVYGAIEERPPLLRALLKLDSMAVRTSWLANLADHYWITFRRK